MGKRINNFLKVSLLLPIIMILIASLLFYISYDKSKNYLECDAKIIDLLIEEDKTYVNKDNRFKIIPTIEYYVNGNLYTAECNFYSSSMRKGETTKILCNPDNPKEFIAKGSLYVIPIVIACIGSVLLAFSVLFKLVFSKLLIRVKNFQ